MSANSRLFRSALALCLALGSLVACTQKASWTEYQHPGGRLTISFPTADLPAGDGTGHAMSVAWNGTSYTVGWGDIGDMPDSDFRLEAANIAGQMGTVTSSSSVTHAGLDGMEFRIKGASGTAILMRYLRKGDRAYELHLEGAKLDPDAPEPQQFLASFRAD